MMAMDRSTTHPPGDLETSQWPAAIAGRVPSLALPRLAGRGLCPAPHCFGSGAGFAVLDLTGLAEGVQRLFDSQEDGRLDRAQRAATADRDGDRGHRDVVRRLEEVVAVVAAEA